MADRARSQAGVLCDNRFLVAAAVLESFRQKNMGHEIDVMGVVINNPFYDGGNDGGPEKRQALVEIKAEAEKNRWALFRNEIPHSRGFPKRMRGESRHPGNSVLFHRFASEFFQWLGLPSAQG